MKQLILNQDNLRLPIIDSNDGKEIAKKFTPIFSKLDGSVSSLILHFENSQSDTLVVDSEQIMWWNQEAILLALTDKNNSFKEISGDQCTFLGQKVFSEKNNEFGYVTAVVINASNRKFLKLVVEFNKNEVEFIQFEQFVFEQDLIIIKNEILKKVEQNQQSNEQSNEQSKVQQRLASIEGLLNEMNKTIHEKKDSLSGKINYISHLENRDRLEFGNSRSGEKNSSNLLEMKIRKPANTIFSGRDESEKHQIKIDETIGFDSLLKGEFQISKNFNDNSIANQEIEIEDVRLSSLTKTLNIKELEVSKPEIPKPETPKPETPKPEIPKPEIPKPEIPKPEIPRQNIPKQDISKKQDIPKPVNREQVSIEKIEDLPIKKQRNKKAIPKVKIAKAKVEKSKIDKAQVEKIEVEKTQINKTQVEKFEVEKAQIGKTQVEKNKAEKSKADKAKVEKNKAEKSKKDKAKVEKRKKVKAKMTLKKAIATQAVLLTVFSAVICLVLGVSYIL